MQPLLIQPPGRPEANSCSRTRRGCSGWRLPGSRSLLRWVEGGRRATWVSPSIRLGGQWDSACATSSLPSEPVAKPAGFPSTQQSIQQIAWLRPTGMPVLAWRLLSFRRTINVIVALSCGTGLWVLRSLIISFSFPAPKRSPDSNSSVSLRSTGGFTARQRVGGEVCGAATPDWQ